MLLLFFACIHIVNSQVFWIRLTGGNGPHEGNVELLTTGYRTGRRKWKYICDDQWDVRDARVVCRQLGYGDARRATMNTHFLIEKNNKPWSNFERHTYFPKSFHCFGREKGLQSCPYKPISAAKCQRDVNVAGVVCIKEESEPVRTKPKLPPRDIKVRLYGESRHGFISSGYLEVLYKGVWGAVLSDGWHHYESFVACGNLGYPDYLRNQISFVEYTGTNVWRNNIRCSGMESRLSECEHTEWRLDGNGSNIDPVFLTCKRSKFIRDNRFDAALISNHTIRIRAGYRHSEGRAEIYHNGQWGSICDDKWSIKNANVFCRQLGFGTAFEATHRSSFGQGSGQVWLDDVTCRGDESDIESCRHASWGRSDCSHKEDAGVKCHYPYGKPEVTVKLSDGSSTLEGNVKILSDGKWKGVCSTGWGLRETTVICRQLGLGYPKKATSRSRSHGNVGEFAMTDVICSGDELSIKHCKFKRPMEATGCHSNAIASVECSPHAPDLVMDVNELQVSIMLETIPLSALTCAFEENCLASDATYKMNHPQRYNRTLLRFTARFWNRGTSDFLPNQHKEKWEWHQCHQHYHSMERFADFDLIDSYGRKVGEGHKASFCLEDFECEYGVKEKYRCTGNGTGNTRRGIQGVSVNCADTYRSDLDCQWIDITGLRPGYHYKLRVVLNPQNVIHESDYSNNIAICDISYHYGRYNYGRVTARNCRIEPCEQMSHGGYGEGACCRFPFVYQGKEYRACTTEGRGGMLWCATTSNYDADGLWGYCGSRRY